MKYKIHLTSGAQFEAELTEYNAETLAANLNDGKTTFISIGDVVMNKHMLSHIAPPVTTESAE